MRLFGRVGQTRGDHIAKRRELRVIEGVEALRFDEFPETYDEVETERVGGQKRAGSFRGRRYRNEY